jgi:hypothetical protein
MKRTQIQMPDHLYQAAHHLAERQEISMAELVRRGLEYMLAVVPGTKSAEAWQLPPVHDLGADDPFIEEDWRSTLHVRDLQAAEVQASYGKQKT